MNSDLHNGVTSGSFGELGISFKSQADFGFPIGQVSVAKILSFLYLHQVNHGLGAARKAR